MLVAVEGSWGHYLRVYDFAMIKRATQSPGFIFARLHTVGLWKTAFGGVESTFTIVLLAAGNPEDAQVTRLFRFALGGGRRHFWALFGR